MDRLSSCYFCGAALDESLSEYPVVPKELNPSEDDQRTVVLCPTCRRKLATVVETVVSAAQADGVEPEADDTDLLDESGMDSQPDPMALSDANETVAEDYPDRDILDRVSDEDEVAETADNQGAEAVGEQEAETADDASDESASEAGKADDSGVEQESAETTDDEPGEQDDSGSESKPALTRLEYSKVMRLLQNRAFPVDRAEIREVAVNAYDIDPEQFDAITDLAIERDLIAEENGQFVSPE